MKNKEFWMAALRRSARTGCQVLISTIGAAKVIEEVEWPYVLSATALAMLLSILTSIMTGLPEVED